MKSRDEQIPPESPGDYERVFVGDDWYITPKGLLDYLEKCGEERMDAICPETNVLGSNVVCGGGE